MFRILTFAVAAAILLPLGTGCRKKAVKEQKEKVIRVGVSKAVNRMFRHRIPVQGTVTPVRYATLSSKTAGTLDILRVDEGSLVKKDELLFQVDKTNLENQVTVAQRQYDVCKSEVDTARISHDLAKIRLHKAEVDFRRAETLRKSLAISVENYESAEVNLKEAKAEVASSNAQLRIAIAKRDQQKNNLEIARKNLADSVIRAPFPGVITVKNVEAKEYVTQGTAIVKIEDQSLLEVVCFISSVYYDLIRPGKTRADFFIEGRNAGSAFVSYRSPSIDPLSRTFKIKILLPKNTPLVSGLLCEVNLILQERKGWGIPAEAIMTRDKGREIVFVLDPKENRAKMIDVKKGIVETVFAEIIGGEKHKDLDFIISGHTFVNQGDRVNPNRQEL